ncbi:serine hydrolase domain-containing protein [Burkholderia sp. LMU1-1-1.1]|uniref:serine hydrolase domain-containing protein n=1 Tax=Burkholderia sp. LMU1-1-1.1 TaxID=3135266 RepID=UPI0034320690
MTMSTRLCVALLAGATMMQAASAAEPLASVLSQWDRDEHPDLRSVLVMRHGAIIAERYYNGETADTLHDIRSAGKSITALLVGAAIDRASIAGADTQIQRYWPASEGTAIGDVTLDNVLTMRSGLDAYDADAASPGNEDKMDEAADPAAFALAVPRQATPGTRYRYNSVTAYIAGVTVEHATGMTMENFARGALFAPLGITRWQWERDAAGHTKGQGNLSLRTRDVARIGQMVLDKGIHQGRRVIGAGWIDAMLAPRVDIGATDRYADHYGYFWYTKTQPIGAQRIPVQFASGNGGNKLYLVPSLDMVVVVTSSAYGKAYGQLRSENILKAILISTINAIQ